MGVSSEDVLEFVADNLHYNKASGSLTWLNDRANGKVKAGSIAGSRTSKGYLQIRVFGSWFKVHRIIWLLENGSWPVDQIDHIDRDTSNNQINNLRSVSNYENCVNRGRLSTTGVVGVTYDKVNKKFFAQTYINGVHKNLGRYPTVEQAKEAYREANKTR